MVHLISLVRWSTSKPQQDTHIYDDNGEMATQTQQSPWPIKPQQHLIEQTLMYNNTSTHILNI